MTEHKGSTTLFTTETGMRPYISAGTEDHKPELHSRPRADAAGVGASNLDGIRAVVVEDEGITQMQLRRSLKNAGATVVASATTGQEGVEAVLRERPDLVLMDVRMPGAIDGLEAAQLILAQYRVCIVMLTAFSDAEYRKRADEINVCAYLVKPVTSETLIPKLVSALRKFESG